MRPLKWRAFYKAHSKIYPVLLINFEFASGLPYTVVLNAPLNVPTIIPISDIELMQFTGLKDKSGKDIYEDDVVIWCDGQYAIKFSTIEGTWILKDDRDDWECPSLYAISSPKQSRIMVIGHIYENPELVETSNETRRGD